MKLKIGDMVRVYGAVEDAEPKLVLTPGSRCKGEVVSIGDRDIYFRDEHACLLRANIKQCRKLVKKERRRVWVSIHETTNSPVRVASFLPKEGHSQFIAGERWFEFVEVKK